MGSAVLIVYFVATYIPQIIIYMISPQIYQESYNVSGYGVAFLAVFIFMSFLAIKVRLFKGRIVLPEFTVAKKYQWLMTLSFVCVAFVFHNSYGTNFRHSNRVSEAGGVVYFLYITKPVALYLVYRYAIIAAKGEILMRSERLQIALIALGLYLSATGSTSIIAIFITTLLASPLYGLFRKSPSVLTLIKISPVLLAAPLIVAFYGLTLKVGLESAKENFFHDNENVIYPLIVRGSSSFASAAYNFERSAEDVFNINPLYGQMQTFLYRLQGFLGVQIDGGGDYLVNINRVNYEGISKSRELERAGASPGLVGSFLYMPNMLVGLLVLLFYMKFIQFGVDRVCGLNLRNKPLAVVASFIFLMPMFESPLAALVVFDPVFVTLLVFGFGLIVKVK